jgi:hypothetical protein
VETPELKALAEDFADRVSPLPWLAGALLISGSIPSKTPGASPTTRTVETHIIVIGPLVGDPPPLRATARSTRKDALWIRVNPYRSHLMDKNKYYLARSTRPLPVGGRDLNFMAVHFVRRPQGGDILRFGFAHRPELDLRGARAKLANDEWIHAALAGWLDGAASPPPAEG